MLNIPSQKEKGEKDLGTRSCGEKQPGARP